MIVIVGAGAVGTILAAHLARAGRDLRLYARPKDVDRFGAVPQLRVEYASGRPPLEVPRPALLSSLDLQGVEALLICTKFPALGPLLDQLPQQIPSGCTLVSTLNGLAAIALIRQRYPDARSVQLTVMFNGQLLAPLQAQITTRAQILIGSGDDQLAQRFAGSGLEVKVAAGETAAWSKLLINLANAISALTHTTFRDLLSDRDLRRIFVAVLDEATAVLDAAGIGYRPPAPLPHRVYRQLLLHGGVLPWWFARLRNGLRDGAYPSMVADVAAGRPTEIDQLNGEIVRLGRRFGVPTPVNAALVERVQALSSSSPQYLRPAELRRSLM